MDKIELLANYLGCDVNDIYEIDNVTYETDYGDFYVCDEYEAEDLVYQDIEQSIEDMGLDAFTSDFQAWIILNAIDEDNGFFEDVARTIIDNEVFDLNDWDLLDALVDANIISSDEANVLLDEEDNEDTIEQLREEYREYLYNHVDCFAYYLDYYGYDDYNHLKQDIVNNIDLLDINLIVNEAIKWDGVAHFLARYDEKEIDLGDGYFAYRFD